LVSSFLVLIIRKHNPGAGLKALPGGFMDPIQGIAGAIVAEKAATAALREATEETGISKSVLEAAQVISVGHRSYDRPFDIRVANEPSRLVGGPTLAMLEPN
jgi:ADP-ribose pyrophosphatase YjhB (NUDIX family)